MEGLLSRATWKWTILGPLLLARAVLLVIGVVASGAIQHGNVGLLLGGIFIYWGFIELFGLAVLTVAPIAASVGARLLVEAFVGVQRRILGAAAGAVCLVLALIAFLLPQPEWGAAWIRIAGAAALAAALIAWVIVLISELRDPNMHARNVGVTSTNPEGPRN